MSNTGAQAFGTETGSSPAPGSNVRNAEDRPRWKSPEWLRRRGVIVLVVLGPVLALTTAVVMGEGAPTGGAGLLRSVLFIDLCYLIALIALIGWRVGSLVMARRRRSAGSHLHLR